MTYHLGYHYSSMGNLGYHYSSMGASIADVGASPYQIVGDPIIALLAQLNRFSGKSIDPPGTTCGSAQLVRGPYPLVPTIDDAAAFDAMMVVWRRYSCTPVELRSFDKEKQMADVLFGSNQKAFVLANLNEIIITIAQFGDSINLEPAKVGITTRDPKMKPPFPTMTVVILGALALGAILISRSRQ